MHFRCVFTLLQWCVLEGLDWVEPMMCLSLHVTCHAFFMHMYLHFSFSFLILICVGAFLHVSFSFSFFLLVALWHLNENPLYPGTLFLLGHLPLILSPPMSGSVMRRPSWTSWRTFHDAAFIQNAKLFYLIFSILTFPLSSTVGVGSHCVLSCHLSLRNYTGILLQYAEIQLFSTSFYYLRLRYDHRSHFGYCIRGATCS